MKINVYTIDLETPRWLRKAIAYVAPVVLVCGAGIAYAKVPHTFQSHQVLTASDLNDNFNNFDSRVSALEAAPSVLTAGSTAGQVGTFWMDTLYPSADLTLPAGTWLVTGFATLSNTGDSDAVVLGLYDQTHGKDLPGSMGPVGYLPTTLFLSGFSTSHVVTLTGPTTLRLKAFRNGSSTINFVDFTSVATALGALTHHKLEAVKLR
jgi:hypothetical protein